MAGGERHKVLVERGDLGGVAEAFELLVEIVVVELAYDVARQIHLLDRAARRAYQVKYHQHMPVGEELDRLREPQRPVVVAVPDDVPSRIYRQSHELGCGSRGQADEFDSWRGI